MRIGLIGAMEEEIEILLELMEDKTGQAIAGFPFTSGVLAGCPVVLAKSGIGKVNAAVCTTLLNQVFKPTYVINTGSAGGFDPSLTPGDVVISTEVCYYDVDVTAFGYAYGQVPRMPARYQADPKLVNLARTAGKGVDGKVVLGLIASGDSFLNDKTRKKMIAARFPELCAVEMEACAIAQACHHFQIPFLIIRSITDSAAEGADVTHEENLALASSNAARLILEIARTLKSGIRE